MEVAVAVVVLLVQVALVLDLAIRAATAWRERGREAEQAQERAEALLRELLTDAEYAQLDQCGYLDVRSPSQPARTYRVPRRPGRVAVREGDAEVESLCVAPVGWLPPGDVVLAHKLMIEGNEQEYLHRANHFRLWPSAWAGP
jgi:hypothetical protein